MEHEEAEMLPEYDFTNGVRGKNAARCQADRNICMDNAQFWDLIEQSRQGLPECSAQASRLTDLLTTLSPKEIYAFDRHFAQYRVLAHRWDLWRVAYLINGGCSDDGFEYFRCWLIGQGRIAYERALQRPESIRDLVIEDLSEDGAGEWECEDLLHAAAYAYEEVTGMTMPPTAIVYPPQPAGEQMEFC